MPKGHHFTHCQHCYREYICGDCITSQCELGDKKKLSCEYYKAHLVQLRARANVMQDASKKYPVGKARAGALLIADGAWTELAEALTDEELATALIEKVWPSFELATEEGGLITAAIERIRSLAARKDGGV